MNFYLPFRSVTEDYQNQKEKETLMQTFYEKTVLIVEPSLHLRLSLLTQLSEFKVQPLGCSTTEEAALYIQSKNNNIDLIIINVLFTTFVESLSPTLDVPVVGLSTTSTTYNLSPHYVKILSTPIQLSQLQTTLLEIFHTTPTKNKTLQHIERPPITILIVEDNPYNMHVAVQMLIKLGYNESHIDRAKNGLEALQLTAKKFYEIILMDLKMPIMNGYDASRQIFTHYQKKCPSALKKVYHKYEHLRPSVIAMTACVMDTDRQKCKKAGMLAFLGKPVIKEELETMLDLILQRRDRAKDQIQKDQI